jgi:hypothetical protein
MCDYMWGNIRVFGYVYIYNLFNRGGQAYFLNQYIENPQILGLLPLFQIRKFLRGAFPQISNSQIFMVNPQIAHPQISTNTAQLCLKTAIANPQSVTFAESPQI